MAETFTQVHTFCGLVGHCWHFIKGFAHIMRPLYNVLGKEVKMGPVHLPQGVGGSKGPERQDSICSHVGLP